MINSIILCHQSSWSIDNYLTLFYTFITALTGGVIWLTFQQGGKNNKQVNSINEFGILREDFEDILNDFKSLKFKVDSKNYDDRFAEKIEKANGVDMLDIFFHVCSPSKNNASYPHQINDFRINVIFPLFKKYEILLNFLNEIKNDEMLDKKYKDKFYKKIEQYLLPN